MQAHATSFFSRVFTRGPLASIAHVFLLEIAFRDPARSTLWACANRRAERWCRRGRDATAKTALHVEALSANEVAREKKEQVSTSSIAPKHDRFLPLHTHVSSLPAAQASPLRL